MAHYADKSVASPEGGLRGLQPPSALKYLPFSDRELRFEKNLSVLASVLTEIGFFKHITSLLEIMQF